ncbi:peptidase family m28 domain-containing protein [Phthorimaea operculella]|nr:peptidase family m28 domain-containing protein [Phthorimaea operculella]
MYEKFRHSCSASVVINKYDDNDCASVIDIGVIDKVKTYKNVTKLIMESVKSGLGSEMYQNYTDFIDKFGARISGSVNLEEAIDYMIQLSAKNGMKNVFTEEVDRFKRSISRNTFIDLKGEIQPDKLVLVSGHIDSWDVGQGAIDDGGGMFISWFVPIALKRLGIKPRRTIRAALWTAEELGLIGSAAYLRKHVDELDNIHFILESDEGTFTPLGLDVAGSQKTKCIIAEILKLFSPIDKMRTSKYPGSDMSQFVAKGVPGASLLNQNERYFYYHHSNADSLDAQNMTAVVECAAFWTAVSYVIADISEDFPKY